MSFINKAILRGLAAPRKNDTVETLSIRLKADGKYVHGLTVDSSTDGPRSTAVLPAEHRKGSLGVLLSPGGVNFKTAKGKDFYLKFTEFSFVFNHQGHSAKPSEPENTEATIAQPKAA